MFNEATEALLARLDSLESDIDDLKERIEAADEKDPGLDRELVQLENEYTDMCFLIRRSARNVA